MGAPSIYVYDCSNAGIIVKSFKKFACQHESEFEVSIRKCKIILQKYSNKKINVTLIHNLFTHYHLIV